MVRETMVRSVRMSRSQTMVVGLLANDGLEGGAATPMYLHLMYWR